MNNLVNGKGGISAEMAVRLSKAFGSSPEVAREPRFLFYDRIYTGP